MKRFIVAAATTTILSIFALPASADFTELDVIFIKADKNGDLVLSKSEFLLVAITQFDIVDSDGDNQLEGLEVGDLASDDEFADNDLNQDGSLSIEEVIEEKLADFDSLDADKDGLLTIDEVAASYDE